MVGILRRRGSCNGSDKLLPQDYVQVECVHSTHNNAAFKLPFSINDARGEPGFKLIVREIEYQSSTNNCNYIGFWKQSVTEWEVYRYPINKGSSGGQSQLGYYQASDGRFVKQLLKLNINKTIFQECSCINTRFTNCAGESTIIDKVRKLDVVDYIGIGCLWEIHNQAFSVSDTKNTCELGYVALYYGNTMIYELIPCIRKSDNKVGMYDLINKEFHSSETSVEFVAGDIIE